MTRPRGMGMGMAIKPIALPPARAFEPPSLKTDTCQCGEPKCPDARQCITCLQRWGRERTQRIVALWNAGTKVEVIAREMGMTEPQVNLKIQKLRRRGVPVPYRKARR